MKFGFEDGGIPAAWRFTGDVEVSNEQQHSGRFSLKIHPEAVVRFFFSDSNRVGKVSMWIYDNGFSVRREKENHFGPLWGVMDQDHEKVFAGIMWQSWLSGNSVYSWASSAQSAALRSRFPMGINREKGWRHWEFACRGPGQPLIILCDGQRVDIDMQRSEYSGGLAGIAFFGGWITALQSASPDTPMALYVDDITIQLMDPPPRKKTVQPEVVPAPFPNARVRINERGVTMVHGRPFFPIAVWAQTTGMIPKHKSLGVNTFVSESDSAVSDPVERKLRLLDACQAAGLMAIVQLEDIVK